MKLKQLYNPTIEEVSYTGFINAINTIKPIDAIWLNGKEAESEDEEDIEPVDIAALDTYIKMHLGNRSILPVISEVSEDTYDIIADLFTAYTYKLDGIWLTMQLDDKYDPLDNVNEITDTKTVVTDDMDTRKTTTDIDERKVKDTIGSRTDNSSGSTTAFDQVTDYDSATDASSNVTGQQINNSESEAAQDVVTEDAYEDEHTTEVSIRRHGNIGVTTSGQLIADYRKSHNIIFFDEVCDVICRELLKSFLYEEED